MTFVEKTGKTVEEAVAAALKEMNLSADQVDVEVLEESKKGFLGFFGKDAKVRVTAKEAGAEVAEKTVKEAADNAVDAVKEVAKVAVDNAAKRVEEVKHDVHAKVEETKAEIEAKVAETKAGIEAKVADAKQKAEAKREKVIDDAIETLHSMKSDKGEEKRFREPRHYAVNDEAVNAAREFLQRVFKAMKIDVAMEKFINKNDGVVTLKLHGDDMGILIGKHGQTLDSLQYLTNLVANKNSNERVRVIIDVEDYRERRIETLTRLASRLADKVKRTGERVELEPMNPHERKIIHMALQGDRRVTTLSEGDDPYRHVVIELKNK